MTSNKNEFIASGISRYKHLLMQAESLKEILLDAGANIDDLDGHVVPQRNGQSHTVKITHTKSEGIPKGKYEWETYTKVILKELGGSGKSSDAIDYAVKANPRIPAEKIKDALRGKFSKMSKSGALAITHAGSRSEGYTYSIPSNG